jgi:hypothetical protein
MSTVFAGIRGIKCLAYFDDIVIFGETLQVHNEKLREVLGRLRKHNLKLQPDKCEFWSKEVAFLEYVITEDGVTPDEKKIEAVRNFPVPTCTRHLAGYYRRFLPNFSRTAKPLTELLRKNTFYV